MTLKDIFPIVYSDVHIMIGWDVVCTLKSFADINILSDKYLNAEINKIRCEEHILIVKLDIKEEDNND